MPPVSAGLSITLSPFRRPTIECMPVDAKAGCLYPNNGRALAEAGTRGFDNCLLCDMLGNVAELATANIFFAKDGVVYTPAANGTFLSGITRHRTIKLLRDAGVTVVEGSFRYPDFQNADEVFSTGNYSKLMPVIRIDERSLQPGPFYRKARGLYWDFAHSSRRVRIVRPCANGEELRAALAPIWHYFGLNPPSDDAIKHFKRVLPHERVHAGFDSDRIVAGTGAFDFDLTIPGGRVKAPGVTVTGVL